MAQLNELTHQPQRLQIMATLAALDADTQRSFRYVRDQLG